MKSHKKKEVLDYSSSKSYELSESSDYFAIYPTRTVYLDVRKITSKSQSTLSYRELVAQFSPPTHSLLQDSKKLKAT